MSNAPLIPCARCARHVRVSEETCPFCNASLEGVAPRRRPVFMRERPAARSRAAVFALLASSSGLAGCSDHNVASSTDGGGSAAMDAAVGQPDEGSLSGAGVATGIAVAGAGGTDFGNPMEQSGPRYRVDASAADDDGATDEEDAGRVPVPIYGGAFPDPKTRAKV